jgi:hypothetical protein
VTLYEVGDLPMPRRYIVHIKVPLFPGGR